jgi:hypothetical protein
MTRFAYCYRCEHQFEDVEEIIDAGGGWCPTCDTLAQREPS